jgi:hypothetical protein
MLINQLNPDWNQREITWNICFDIFRIRLEMDGRLLGFKNCFRDDALRLVTMFNARNTLKYFEFIELWNEMKFFEVFALVLFF